MQIQWNASETKCKHNEMQIRQDANETYYKCNKMQMRHIAMKQTANVTNSNVTKCK